MDPSLISLIKSKQAPLRSITASGGGFTINKTLNVEGDLNCKKLICDIIEVNATGNKTKINDALITKSSINSTQIGLKKPAISKFTQVLIDSTSSGLSDVSFKTDGDINFFNSDKQLKKIKSLLNPLMIQTDESFDIQTLKAFNMNSNITNLHTTIFNINTSQTTTNGLVTITNNSNLQDNYSLSTLGGVFIKKDLIILGNINVKGNNSNYIEGPLILNNNITTSGVLKILNNSNKALIIHGGTEIQKDLYVNNNVIIRNNNNQNNILYGNTYFNKNVYISNNLNVNNSILLLSTKNSNSIDSGALNIKGGIGIHKNVYIGGNTNIFDEFRTYNNAFFYKNMEIYDGLFVNNNIVSNNNVIVNSTTDNSIETNGGLYVKKNIITDNELIINSESNQALVVNGSSYIKKNVNVSDSVYIQNNLQVNNSFRVHHKSEFNNTVTINNNLYTNDIILSGRIINNTNESNILTHLNIIDDLQITGNKNAFDYDSGSFICNGGGSIKKNLFIKQNLNVLHNLNVVKNMISDKINTNNIIVKYNIVTTDGNFYIGNKKIGTLDNPSVPFDTLKGNINLANNMSTTEAFSKIDQYINTYFIDTPPILENINEPVFNNFCILLEFKYPQQFNYGFINQKLPFIHKIIIEYKKYSESNYISIENDAFLFTKIKLFAFSHNNFIEDSTYHLFNLEVNTKYNFRIYLTNYNNERPIKYLYYNNVIILKNTNLIKSPENIHFSNLPNNTGLISFNLNSTIPIYQLKIQYNTIASIRYPTFVNSNNELLITTNNILNNVPTNIYLYNLNAGHTYNLNIQAKTIYNKFFGLTNSLMFTTSYPSAPLFINNNNLSIQNKYILGNGIDLSNQSFVSNILNLSNPKIETNILRNIRINEFISNSDFTTIQVNVNNINYNVNISSFSNNSNNSSNSSNDSIYFENNINIILNNTSDFYNNILNSGFYKKTDIQITSNTTNLFNYKQNLLQINQLLPNQNIILKTKPLYMYFDNYNSNAIVSNININKTYINYRPISGVNTYNTGELDLDFNTTYLTNRYMRHDGKHFSIFANHNTGLISNYYNINSDYFQNSNKYYNPNNSIHNDGYNILPNTNILRFKNIKMSLFNNNYSENINIFIKPYNLLGESLFNKESNIRLDGISFNSIHILSNSNSQYGMHVFSGNHNYDTNNINIQYNHNHNLINNKELQLVNGFFCTPNHPQAFLNYYNIDYSVVKNSIVENSIDYRYVTFKYTNILNDTNKITIEFINSNISEFITDNILLFIKVQDQTAWLNANDPINVIGINNNNKKINNTGCLDYIQSTAKKKYCYLPNGSFGTLYIRLGIKSNINYYIKYIKVTAGFV